MIGVWRGSLGSYSWPIGTIVLIGRIRVLSRLSRRFGNRRRQHWRQYPVVGCVGLVCRYRPSSIRYRRSFIGGVSLCIYPILFNEVCDYSDVECGGFVFEVCIEECRESAFIVCSENAFIVCAEGGVRV